MMKQVARWKGVFLFHHEDKKDAALTWFSLSLTLFRHSLSPSVPTRTQWGEKRKRASLDWKGKKRVKRGPSMKNNIFPAAGRGAREISNAESLQKMRTGRASPLSSFSSLPRRERARKFKESASKGLWNLVLGHKKLKKIAQKIRSHKSWVNSGSVSILLLFLFKKIGHWSDKFFYLEEKLEKLWCHNIL